MSEDSDRLYCDVLLPLAIPRTYSYAVPGSLQEQVQFGRRVEVPLRNKLYSGIVITVHKNKPDYRTRYILSVLDDEPLIGEKQFLFWQWLADFYCSRLGEVMQVALPSALKLSSETRLLLNESLDFHDFSLNDQEYLIAEAIELQNELSIENIREILGIKTVYPFIKELLRKKIIVIREELQSKYRKKKKDYVRMLIEDPEEALQFTSRSEKQSRAVLAYFALAGRMNDVPKSDIYEMAEIDSATIASLAKKGLIEVYQLDESRLHIDPEDGQKELESLSPEQEEAVLDIQRAFSAGQTVLLHGVTGSGKTRVYAEIIRQILDEGGQVLYLLPEIALTNQIVRRLQLMFGSRVLMYHSRINENERVELWNAALVNSALFAGARSALFLPFYNLRLVIVDEEHDSSFKQQSPNPRYQGRDAAVYLANLYNAQIILGSATPSLESFWNGVKEKYHCVSLHKRFGDARLPAIELVDLKSDYKKGLVKEGLSATLIQAMDEALKRSEQVILFQNRRGYAPIQRCRFCSWVSECPNCDVSLTYHQVVDELKCHFCGYKTRTSDNCPACGNPELELLGMGTQKVEEILPKYISNARIARFDYDTTRTKSGQEEILNDFEEGRIDILVGTQMVTKGFDFERISLVGILNADSLLNYPDFRSAERCFQLMMQVAGRAGRRDALGKVIIQSYNPVHPVIQDVFKGNQLSFYQRELAEREKFHYPPFVHMIAIWFRHKELEKARKAAESFRHSLRSVIGKRVSAPIDPPILRLRNLYHQLVYVKCEKKSPVMAKIKTSIIHLRDKMSVHPDYKSVQVQIDVDPY